MCGIAGYLNFSKSDHFVDENILQNMQQVLAYRGPDGHSVWKSDECGIGLAHRRLSIIDLSDNGAQPMLDREKSVVVCFNGEIYNHLLLRRELGSLGYNYFSNTDTETLIYAYKEWGIDFIHKLDGMFAIALFDISKNELYLIRDRIGIKPLYFSIQDGILGFSSEIKALWQMPWLKKNINKLSLYHYLTYLVTPAPMTLYENVYKLPAGFYAKVDSSRNITFHEWYSPIVQCSELEKKKFEDENFCKENIRNLLRQSVKKRMMSDVPVGVFLSGGIDSSLNVALMSEFSNNIKTFNVVFSDGLEFDERRWAKKVADEFGTEHHEIVVSEKEACEVFETIVFHQDEPLADWVCVPLYFVAQLAREHGIPVVQIGEGSDELFCGYGSYVDYLNFYNRYWKRSQKIIPPFLRKRAYSISEKLFRNFKYFDHWKNWSLGRNLFWSGAIAFRETGKRDLFLGGEDLANDSIIRKIYAGLRQDFDSYNIVDYHLAKLSKLDFRSDFLKSMIYLEFKQRLPELLLMRADKMTMAASVEGRVPFLDHKLVEFVLQMPSSLKYKNGTTKYILKKACEGILPHEVIYRKKVGFSAPAKYWLQEGKYFKTYFEKLMGSKKSVLGDLLNFSYIENLFKQHQSRRRDLSPQLWLLQNLFASI